MDGSTIAIVSGQSKEDVRRLCIPSDFSGAPTGLVSSTGGTVCVAIFRAAIEFVIAGNGC